MWREITHVILNQVGGFGLDSALFLMDSRKIQLIDGLPSFIKDFLRCGVSSGKGEKIVDHLYNWLLEETLICGGQTGYVNEASWNLKVLCVKKESQIVSLIEAGGSELNNAKEVALVWVGLLD